MKELVKKIGEVIGGSVDSRCHKLSENILFLWSNGPFSGKKGIMLRLLTMDGRNVKIWQAIILSINNFTN